MKVTGWTYWEDPDYIDLNDEHTKIAIELTKDISLKIPDRETFSKMSEEEQVKVLQERRIAFNSALDNDELRKVDALITEAYKVVIEEVRKNGYHFTGNDHQNADWGVPILDNKYKLCVGQRSWGGIIADAFPDEIDESKEYGYIKWAWSTPEGEEDKIKIPSEN